VFGSDFRFTNPLMIPKMVKLMTLSNFKILYFPFVFELFRCCYSWCVGWLARLENSHSSHPMDAHPTCFRWISQKLIP
jgi:hypothetical protein